MRVFLLVLALARWGAPVSCAQAQAAQGLRPKEQRPSVAAPQAEGLLDSSAALLDEGKDREAIALLRRALASGPDSEAADALGWALLRVGDPLAAKAAFSEALGRSPTFYDAKLGLAVVSVELKDFDRAITLLKELAQQRPRWALPHYFLGHVYEVRSSTRPAIDAYLEVLKADGQFVEARSRLAALIEQEGRPDEAWRHYTRLSYADPGNRGARAALTRLTARLTKKPEEILPPKRIHRHTRVSPIPDRERLPEIWVGIGTGMGGKPLPRTEARFRSSADFHIVAAGSGKEIARGRKDELWVVKLGGAGMSVGGAGRAPVLATGPVVVRTTDPATTVIVGGLVFASGFSWGGIADKELRGELRISRDASGKSLVLSNRLSLEEYLYGVLNAEMPGEWPLEAMKAQAVIARSQALYRKQISRPHGAEGYHVCDGQHCQVYTGVPAETQRARRAVDESRGLILTHNGKPAHTVFFSNCGGRTSSGPEIGWAELPYWRSISDKRGVGDAAGSAWIVRQRLRSDSGAYCSPPKHSSPPEHRWDRVVTAEELEQKLSRRAPLGSIQALAVASRSPSGRVRAILIRGSRSSLRIEKEHEIRRLLGVGPLRSTLFFIDTVRRNGRPHAFIFRGAGWGHGIGMCQAGAGGRADAGHAFGKILEAYYPGTLLRAPAGPGRER